MCTAQEVKFIHIYKFISPRTVAKAAMKYKKREKN